MRQLQMFPEAVDYEKEMDKMKEDFTKLRKSLFAQQGDLRKQYTEVAHELQMLKLNICRGRII
jgi:hypothetical protein